MSETNAADGAVVVAKRRGPPKGFKMPENMVPRDVFIKAFIKVSKAGGTRPDVATELQSQGYDYVDIGTVTSRERYLREQGAALPVLKSARGQGGGKAIDVDSLNAYIAKLEAGEE